MGQDGKETNNMRDIALSVFSEFFSRSSDPCYVKDREFRYVAVSDGFVKFLGRDDRSFFIGKTDIELFGDNENCKKHDALDRDVLESGCSIEREPVVVTRSDGEEFYTLVTKTPVKDPSGNIIGILGRVEDQTASHEASLRFQKQIDMYMTLPDNALCCAFVDITDWKMQRFTALVNGEKKSLDISFPEFITRSDRIISVDINEHRYFANLDRDNFLRQFKEGLPGSSTEFFVNAEGHPPMWVDYRYFFLTDPANGHVCIIFSVLDISSQREKIDAPIRADEQDPITGLLNHESVLNKIGLHLETADEERLSALFIINVDNFSEINDKFGMRTGDNVLSDIADRIRSCFREGDIIGRLDGDEFIVLMTNLDKTWAANNAARELMNALRYNCERNGESVLITSSVGAAVIKGPCAELKDLYTEADLALYNAKHSGKNKICFSDDTEIDPFGAEATVADMSIDLQTVLGGLDGILIIAELLSDELSIVYSSNPMYGQEIIELMPAKEYETLIYTIRKAHESGEPSMEFTESAPHTYRGKPRWTRIKGTFTEPDRPGALKLIMLVSDIYEFKNNEQLLKHENTKFDLALSISNTITWEYDTTTKLLSFHNVDSEPIPYIDDDMVEDESRRLYEDMYSNINRGVTDGSEFIHFKSFLGKNIWMQVSFKTLFNESGHVIGALFAAHDISNFIKNADKYENAKRGYQKYKEDGNVTFRLDLTNDRIVDLQLGHDLEEPGNELITAKDFLKYMASLIDGEDEAAGVIREFFTFENLSDLMDSGTDSVEEEFLLKLNSMDSEWFRLRAIFLTNPETHTKQVFAYLQNINLEHTSQTIIDRIFNFEYEFLAVIDTSRKTIKILQNRTPHLQHLTETVFDYEEMIFGALEGYIVPNDVNNCAHDMDIRNLRKELANKDVYGFSYSVYEAVESGELQLKRKRYLYTYLDETKRYIALTKSDITDQYKSGFDPVTGLYNRASFYTHAREFIDSKPRTSYVIVCWDIDKFKLFNDIFGVQAGDELLSMVGNAYRNEDQFKKDVILGNLGGDNFAICMEKSKFDPDEHSAFVMNTLASLGENYSLNFHMAGYVVTDPSIDINIMCDRAGIAVKSIKDKASTRFTWYDESMRLDAVKEVELISEIRQALKTDQFVVYIQPQFNQMTMKLVSGESLVRWQKPDGSLVPPNIFVPVLEKTGLVTRVDQIVWDLTCQFLSKRKKEGKPNVPIAVNISRRDFYNPHFTDIFFDLIERYDIEPELLDLEVTESAYIENPDVIFGAINKLRARGFSVKMDDFGSGYSSLNTLKHVPVDMIKLDMNFLYFDEDDESSIFRGGVILDSVLRMAHFLGLPVIAEGVETAKQADFLKTIDCAIVQGYYFSKPLPINEFEAMLDSSVINETVSLFNLDNNFDNYDFWDPTSQTSLLFNTFIGAAGIFEYYKGRMQAIRLNNKFFREVGLKPDVVDFSTINLLEVVVKEDMNKIIDAVEKASSSSDELTVECRFIPVIPQAEKYLWFRLKARRIAHTELRKVFFVSIENITDRKVLEAKSTNLAKLLAAAVDSSDSAMFSYEPGEKMKVTTYSSHLAGNYGFTEAEYYQRFGKHQIQGIHPDDREALLGFLNKPFPNNRVTITYDCRHICKDGSYKPIHFTIYKPALIDDKLVGYFVVTTG